MTKPVRLQLSRRRGFSLQALSRETNGLEAINVTRQGAFGGLLGNPWKIGSQPYMSRDMVLSLYEVWITCQASDADVGPEAAELRKRVLDKLPEIRGKNLACTCSLPMLYERDLCHADVLLALANPGPEIANAPL